MALISHCEKLNFQLKSYIIRQVLFFNLCFFHHVKLKIISFSTHWLILLKNTVNFYIMETGA